MIANDPAMYAYLHSKDNLGKENIRVISIGTGATHPQQIDPKEVTVFTWINVLGTLLTVTEQLTHEYLMARFPQVDTYRRYQAIMDKDYGIDAYADDDIKIL
jgi:hypothetical protein